VNRWSASLWLASALTQASAFATRLMVSYRALEDGHGAASVGLLSISFSVIPLVMAVYVGRWIDRTGERRAAIIGAALLAGSSLLTIPLHSLGLLMLVTAVFGLGQLVCIVSQQTAIANRVAPARHEQAFARYNISASLGQLAGPVVVTSLAAAVHTTDGHAATGTGLAIAASFAVLTLVASMTAPRGVPGGSPAGPVGGTVRGAALLSRPGMRPAMLMSLSSVATQELLLVYLPVWGVENGVSKPVVGLLLSARATATIVSQFLVGPFLARLGRRRVLLGSLFVAAAAMAVLPWCTQVTATIPVFVLGLTFGLNQPITLAWVVAVAGPGSRGAALALRVTANRIGQVLVPGVAAGLSWASGTSAVFWLSSALLSATAVAGARA
jgi:MFS family permease